MNECCVEARQRNCGWKWLPWSGVRGPTGRIVSTELRGAGRYLLVGRSHAGAAVTAGDLKDDRCLDCFVDGGDDVLADIVAFRFDLEDLNLGDLLVTSEVDCRVG